MPDFANPCGSHLAIVSLPVTLILEGGSSSGIAMMFALLIAAMIWNIGI